MINDRKAAWVVVVLATMAVWSSHAAFGQRTTNQDTTAGKAADPTKPFVGRFVGEAVKLISSRSGDNIRGELIKGDDTFDFVGKVVDGQLKGTVKAGGVEFKFKAAVEGEYLTLIMGIDTFKLKRFADSPLVNKVRMSGTLIVESTKVVDRTAVVSEDNRFVAYVESGDGKFRVAVNGTEGKPFFRIANLALSPTGGQVGYFVIQKDRKFRVVVGNHVGDEFGQIVSKAVLFSKDGKRSAYIAIRNEKFHVVIDGKESRPYRSAGAVVFTDDGQRVGYIAKYDGKWRAVIDGKEEAGHEGIGRFVFSPNGKRYAYPVLNASTQQLVIDGQAGSTLEAIPWVQFSPDSKRVAYGVVKNFRASVVVDDKAGSPFDQTNFFSFSPNSQGFAYRAAKDGKRFIVIGDNAGEAYDEVGKPVLSPDGKTLAFKALVEKQTVVFVNGEKSKPCDAAFALTFSPNGKRLAYIARRGRNWLVVADGHETPLFDSIQRAGIVFSPDSEHVVFGAARDGKQYIVVDGIETELPGRFMNGSRHVFVSPSQFHTMAQRGNKFNRVDVKILK